MSADTLVTPQRNAQGRFLTGNNGGGRPRGSRNKLGEEFLSALCADFQQHGEEAIAECRLTNPSVYVRVIASLLPREPPDAIANELDRMSDDELRAYINDPPRLEESDGSSAMALTQ